MNVTDDELALRFALFGTSLIGENENILPSSSTAAASDVLCNATRIWLGNNLMHFAFCHPQFAWHARNESLQVLRCSTMPTSMQIAELQRRKVLCADALQAFMTKCGEHLPEVPNSAKRARRA